MVGIICPLLIFKLPSASGASKNRDCHDELEGFSFFTLLLLGYYSVAGMLLGGKYLVFVSSRSVKMRGFSFLSLHAF